MTETIPDLWPTSEIKTDILTPLAILRMQATHLSQTTQGILIADVTETYGTDGQVVLSLDVVVPALKNYRHRLLTVQHTKEAAYPAKLSARGLRITKTVNSGYSYWQTTREEIRNVEGKTAYSQSDFMSILGEALQAPETVALLQSLIVKSNETQISPPAATENGGGQRVKRRVRSQESKQTQEAL